MDDFLFPFKPGDWVIDNGIGTKIAKVKGIDLHSNGEVTMDLWMYSRDGIRLGRVSPIEGGPRTFEPCCSIEGWSRIAEPNFPITLKWVPRGRDGAMVGVFWAGDPLPPANWKKRKHQARAGTFTDKHLREALEQIATGHNDATRVAREALRLV